MTNVLQDLSIKWQQAWKSQTHRLIESQNATGLYFFSLFLSQGQNLGINLKCYWFISELAKEIAGFGNEFSPSWASNETEFLVPQFPFPLPYFSALLFSAKGGKNWCNPESHGCCQKLYRELLHSFYKIQICNGWYLQFIALVNFVCCVSYLL